MTARRVDQGMAEAAARLLPAKVNKELRTRYRQLRIMTHTAGLAATYAFIAAKAGEKNDLAAAYQRAGEGIRERLAGLGLLPGDTRRMTAQDMLRELGRMDPVQYARASTEVSVFTGWLARLADAMYQAEKPPAGGGGPGAAERTGW
jgi:CRISPR/Cas system CMR-associated protein Cmr5 small subunit